MLALSIFAPAFLPSATTPFVVPTVQRPAAASVVLRYYDEEPNEIAKNGVIASFFGSLASAPVKMSVLLATNAGSTAVTDFSNVALAIQLAVFGVVYRYAVRNDENDKLKQLTVGSFSIVRAFSCVNALSTSKIAPDKWVQVAAYFGESALAFGLAAAALEYAWGKGWCRRLPGYSGLPFDGFGPTRFDPYVDDRQYRASQFRSNRQVQYRDGEPYYDGYSGRDGIRGRLRDPARDPVIR